MKKTTLKQMIQDSPEFIGDVRCFIFKCPNIDFGPGDWANEPDFILWQDAHTSLYCAIIRSPVMGNLCGYVAVPETHPLYRKSEHAVHIDCEKPINYANASIAGNYENYQAIESPLEDKLWWFGFDCMHASDLTPATEKELLQDAPNAAVKEKAEHPLRRFCSYKDVAFVMLACTELSATLSSLSHTP